MDHAVVIAGGGPTGLLLACELGLAGVDAIVIERALQPPRESRGLAFHARSVDILEQRGLKSRLGDHIPTFDRNHFALFWVDMTALGVSPMYIMPQWRVEEVLEERARELGVPVRRGHEVIAVDAGPGEVTVAVRGDGGEYDLRADYLVGADGGRSTVRKAAGFAFPGTGASFYGILADVAEFEENRERVEVGLWSGGAFGEVQLAPDRLRLMTTEFDYEAPPDDVPVTIGELTASIERISGKRMRIGAPRWLSRFSDTTRQAERYRQGRVFLAGDAAHVFYPIGGQGLNTGIQDAFNLGWKLAAEINGWAPPGLLDSYHDERHPVGRAVCVNTRAQLALMYPLDAVGPLRELFGELLKMKEVSSYLLEMVAGSSIRYPMPYEAGPLDHPLAGLALRNVPAALTGALQPGRGVVYDLSGGTADLGDLSGWAGRVDVVTAPPVPELDAAVLLARPDGHVAWADATGKDADGLGEAVTTWFGAPGPA
jgi:2-polyprenyl-6-methoxyphenol hydroxylase-like FAD-dependent oxidoreductase